MISAQLFAKYANRIIAISEVNASNTLNVLPGTQVVYNSVDFSVFSRT